MRYHHIVPHIDIAVVAAIAIVVLYKPPKSSRGIATFIDRRWGDSIGFYILHLGIILIVLGGVYPQVQGVSQIGNSLIIAAMGILKLASTPKDGMPPSPAEPTPAPPPAPPPSSIPSRAATIRNYPGAIPPMAPEDTKENP